MLQSLANIKNICYNNNKDRILLKSLEVKNLRNINKLVRHVWKKENSYGIR